MPLILGTAANDSLSGDSFVEGFQFSEPDTIRGLDGNDTLNGRRAEDSLDGGAGDDRLIGEQGNDTLDGGAGNDNLFGGSENDILDGGAGNDTLWGEDGNDILFGGSGGARMFGGAGDDFISAGEGVSVAQGGTGADVFRMERSEAFSYFQIGDFSAANGDLIDVSALGLTNLAAILANTTFNVDFQGAEIRVQFGSVEHVIILEFVDPDNLTAANFIFAAEPDQTIPGTDGNETLTGGTGNDVLDGMGGDDRLVGGAGNDLLVGGAGNDSLIGGAGNDTLFGGSGINSLTGGTGADVFAVSRGGDTTITDFSIADGDRIDLSELGISDLETFQTIANYMFSPHTAEFQSQGMTTRIAFSNTGADAATPERFLFSTVATDDIITANGDGAEVLFGGLGNDTLQAAGGFDTLFGEAGDDVLFDSVGQTGDVLFGGSGNDSLTSSGSGGEDSDELYGGVGDDTITVLGGNASTNGGAGADTFKIGADGSHTLFNINDFSSHAGDLIDVSALGITTLAELMTYGRSEDGTAIFEITINGISKQIYVWGVQLTDLSAANFVFAPEPGQLITGTDATADDLLGGAGNDTLQGLGGNDRLNGAAGNDSLDGGAGNDSLIGGAGNDWLQGGTGQDRLEGGDGDDRYYVDDAGDLVVEAANGGTDRVYSSIGYRLADGVHVETLSTTSQAGLTNINLVGNEFSQSIIGNAGANRLSGWGGNDRLSGLAGDDRLDGGDGSDTLVGGDGNDTLLGGDGGDRMSGGLGDDTYYVDNVADRITETADQGSRDRVFVEGLASFTLSASHSIEGLSAIGESSAAMNLTGNDLSQSITGNGGVNILRGLGGDDTLDGRSGNDSLDGGVGNDSLIGGAGNDGLRGGTGQDTLEGGTGDDRYFVDDAGDLVVEAANGGTDRVYSSISYSLAAGVHVETLSTTSQSGMNVINLTGNEFSQSIIGNAGANMLFGEGGDDRLSGLAGDDELNGGDGSDMLVGGDGNDSLLGGNGGDLMIGGSGDDVLRGGAGADTLTGGLGADTFVFQTAIGGTEVDRITDFAVNDTIALLNSVFSGIATGTLMDAAFEANDTGVATQTSTRIVYESDTGRLVYDADGSGDGVGVHFATLNRNIDGISAADFLIV